jgi:DNA-binding response OmpR family regulator
MGEALPERARRALIIEDDADIATLVGMYLGEAGFQVNYASDGADGLAAFIRERPDIIILDVMLPSMDGYEVCRRVRQIASTPVIMLTARQREEERIVGLDLGADDYVTKPFSPRELVSRARAVLRRAATNTTQTPAERPSQLTLGDLTVRLDARRVELRGQTIDLTPKEFDLLVTLASAPDHVFSREELLSRVWGFDYLGDSRTVDVHIGTLRKKIERAPEWLYHIRTVWGQGYMLETEPASAGGPPR